MRAPSTCMKESRRFDALGLEDWRAVAPDLGACGSPVCLMRQITQERGASSWTSPGYAVVVPERDGARSPETSYGIDGLDAVV